MDGQEGTVGRYLRGRAGAHSLLPKVERKKEKLCVFSMMEGHRREAGREAGLACLPVSRIT